jgi:hypothetical protein
MKIILSITLLFSFNLFAEPNKSALTENKAKQGAKEYTTKKSNLINKESNPLIYEKYKNDCIAEIDKRPANYKFLQKSDKIDLNYIKGNPALFNLLAQLSKTKLFTDKIIIDNSNNKRYFTCIDIAKKNERETKISFGFKIPFTPGLATEYLKYSSQMGEILNKINSNKYNNLSSEVKNVSITGFADQQHSYPINYGDKKGLLETLNESLSTRFASYPIDKVTTEIDFVKNELQGKIQNEDKISDPNYMSSVRVNQLLGLNRAIQIKRGILSKAPSIQIEQLKDLENGFSSCKNEVSKYMEDYQKDSNKLKLGTLVAKPESCDKRRIAVVEADVKTWGVYKPGTQGSGLNFFYVESANIEYNYNHFKYGQCAVNNSSIINADLLKFAFMKKCDLAFGANFEKKQPGMAGKLNDINKYKQTNQFIKNSCNSHFNIYDIVKSANANLDPEVFLKNNEKNLADSIYKLKLPQDFFYKLKGEAFYPIKAPADKFWYFNFNPASALAVSKQPKTLADLKDSILYFDPNCSYMKSNYQDKTAFDKLKILSPITDDHFTQLKQIYKQYKEIDFPYKSNPQNQIFGVPGNSCVLVTYRMSFSDGCPDEGKANNDTLTVTKQTPPKPSENIFPNYGFDKTETTNPYEFAGDTINGLVSKYGTSIDQEVKRIQSMICTENSTEFAGKPTVDEQKDCE